MKIIVSSCLLGIRCRWHGKKTSISSFVKKYIKNNPDVELIPVCPEMLGGLPCPRPPVKRMQGRIFETCEDKNMRKNVTGKELTEIYRQGAINTLVIAKQNSCEKAILCQWSPSCDKEGITGKLLTSQGIEVINTF